MNKQDLIIDIINNPYILSCLNRYNLSSSYVSDHFSCFYDAYNSLNKCKNCKGLYECSQKKVGEVLTLAYDGAIYNDITYCKYYVEKLREDKQRNSFIRSDIPENFVNLNLDNIELVDSHIENLCLLCYDILNEKRNKGLYIYGDLGVGKTYMSMALANSLVKKGKKVAFLKCNYFINDMRKLIAINSDEYTKVIESLKKAHYLFLDDIGSEAVSSYSRDDLLFNILDYRMENNLCTIFTSNLSKESLLNHYTYDKKDNSSIVRARRLLERIDILSDNFVLEGENKRRKKDLI